MYITVRQCCCALETFVRIVGILLSTSYVLVAGLGVAWFVLSYEQGSAEGGGLQVSDFEQLLQPGDDFRSSVILLACLLATSFLGLLTNLMLVVGVKTEQRLLLLPWLCYHVILVLVCLGGGLYLALYFTVLNNQEDYLSAIASLFPIIFGIFFIFVWILVDQLYLKLRHQHQLEKMVASRRASLASIHSMYQKSAAESLNRNLKRGSKYVQRAPSAATTYTLSSRFADLPKMKRSKSLEQILDSSTSSSSGAAGPNYWVSEGFYSQPRPAEEAKRPAGERPRRPPQQRPAVHAAYVPGYEHNTAAAAYSLTLPKRARQGEGRRHPMTDTMRSSKSVTIHPRVTEYHYRNSWYSDLHGEVGLPQTLASLGPAPSQLIVPPAAGGTPRETLEASVMFEDEDELTKVNRAAVEPVYHKPNILEEDIEAAGLFWTGESTEGGGNYELNSEDAGWGEQDREVAQYQTLGYKIPAPVYPESPAPYYSTLPRNKDWMQMVAGRARGFTKDQIIGYYCTSSGEVLL